MVFDGFTGGGRGVYPRSHGGAPRATPRAAAASHSATSSRAAARPARPARPTARPARRFGAELRLLLRRRVLGLCRAGLVVHAAAQPQWDAAGVRGAVRRVPSNEGGSKRHHDPDRPRHRDAVYSRGRAQRTTGRGREHQQPRPSSRLPTLLFLAPRRRGYFTTKRQKIRRNTGPPPCFRFRGCYVQVLPLARIASTS